MNASLYVAAVLLAYVIGMVGGHLLTKKPIPEIQAPPPEARLMETFTFEGMRFLVTEIESSYQRNEGVRVRFVGDLIPPGSSVPPGVTLH